MYISSFLQQITNNNFFDWLIINKKFDRNSEVFDLTLSGPAISVVRLARGGGGLKGPDAKNQG